MGKITGFIRQKLIIAVLISKEDFIKNLLVQLENKFGPIDYISEILTFNYTNYYNPEMGPNIKRFFLSFQELISPDNLPDIKIMTNTIENSFREDKNRQINLDPGMLSMKSFILATTKDNGHRIPLQKGIYGEVTLLFVNKKFQSLPWTYIDYQSEEYSKVLEKIRIIYKENIKQNKI